MKNCNILVCIVLLLSVLLASCSGAAEDNRSVGVLSDHPESAEPAESSAAAEESVTELCSGIRIIGSAGGTMHFISVSELSVETADDTGDQ